MNDWTASQIKELISVEIKAERHLRNMLRIEDRERFEEYKETQKEVLRVYEVERKRDQTELERRLTVLNHAHDEARNVLRTYLPREVWDKFLEEHRIWARKVDSEIAGGAGRSSGGHSMVQLLYMAAVAIVAVLSLVISLAR